MTLSVLKERYLHIAKQSLGFLKEQGFKKKANCYTKQKGDFIFEIDARTPRSWSNSETCLVFAIAMRVWSLDQQLIDLNLHMGEKKNLNKAYLVGFVIRPDNYDRGGMRLLDTDSPEFDENFIADVKEKIKAVVLPFFDSINSLDDIIQIAERESNMDRSLGQFYQHANVYYALVCFYAAKGWKEKFLQMCEKYIETCPGTARHLAVEDREKLIKYFDEVWK